MQVTALLGFVNLGTFSDLAIWSSWALFCAIMAGVALYLHSQEQASDEYESGYAVPQMPSANIARKECPNCHAINEVGSLFCSSCGYRFPVQTFCKNCGKQLKPGNTFCTNCGTKCD